MQLESVTGNSQLNNNNCCYEVGSCIAAGVDVIVASVMHVWNVTFGLLIHRMIILAARRWDWLDQYYRENPDAVVVAVIGVITGIFLSIYMGWKWCWGEEETPPGPAFPPTALPNDQVHLNAGNQPQNLPHPVENHLTASARPPLTVSVQIGPPPV